MTRIFLTVFATAVLAAAPAHAGFVAAITSAISAFAATSAVASFAVNMAISAGMSLISRALAPKQKPQGPGAVQLEAATEGDDTPQRIILGRRAVSGHRTAPEYVRGAGNEWLTIIRDLSDLPVHGLAAVWIGQDRVEIPAGTTGWFDLPEKFVGKARLRFYDGNQMQADPHLVASYGSHKDRPWTADMVLRGVAYVIVELKRDQELFSSIPDLIFEVDGIPLTDPRTGRAGYSRNAALMIWNVMRGITLPDGSVWGGGLDAADLPAANWASAITEAETQGWTAGLEVEIGPADYGGDTPADVIEHLLQACAGNIAEDGGVWRIRIGGPGLPVATVTNPDVIISENQVFTPHQGPREVYNGIAAQYPEPAERWQSKAAPLVLDQAFAARDGGRNVVAITYHAVTDSEQVQKLVAFALADGRRQRQHELSLPPDYAAVEVLDTLTLSLDYDGYAGKLVEVQAVYRDPVTMVQRVHVREVDPADYTAPQVAPLPTVSVVTTPPAPQVLPGWAVEPVIVQDDQGRSRRSAVRIKWTPIPGLGVEWELRAQGASALAGQGSTPAIERGDHIITAGVISGARMEVRARVMLTGRARAWTDWTGFVAPTVGITAEDFEEQLRADLERGQEQAAAAAADALAARADATAAREELFDATADLSGQVQTLAGQLRDGLGAARDYTDTGLQQYAGVFETELGQLAGRINEITAANTSNNLLVNPDFADGITGWTVGAATPENGGARVSAGHFGQFVDASFDVAELLQWRVEISGGAGTVRVLFYGADGAALGTEFATRFEASAAPKVISGQHAPPDGATRFRWRVVPTDPVWIDNAAATKIDQQVIARIQAVEVASATTDQALTALQTRTESRFADAEAAIQSEAATRAAQDQALASQINTVGANAAAKNRTFRQAAAPAASGLAAGDLWVRTADNRMHRWNGSAWVEVKDADLTKLDASVTTQATAISDLEKGAKSGYLIRAQAGDAVSLIDLIAADGKGGVPKSIIKFQAEQLVMDGSVGANLLTVGMGKNLLVDPSFDDGFAHYAASHGGNSAFAFGVRNPGESYAHPAWPTLFIREIGITGINAFIVAKPLLASGSRAVGVPVSPNQHYIASGYYRTARGDARLVVRFYDAAGALMPGSTFNTPWAAAARGVHNIPDQWERVFIKALAPAGAAYAEVLFQKQTADAGAADSWLWVWKPQLEEVHAAATLPSPWAPAGSTAIHGGRTITKSLTADKINVAELSALTATVGVLRTATTGARMEIRNDRILVYDASNVLRVRMGNLA
ncbi:MAG: phage tail protein [Paracoccus sp. (in: a-proteobacteria)]|uniref:phage tail protein n=1 Tax=Paracoccus sp. TaxID=267 RepID=UPI0026DFC5E0|nr:phage tail protein [Paracoccus sp. (in: a-proteobacteria)]MDO5621908.1 phage tail protein [Paracoccus sp. (in: a-proteobacteria)]